MAANDFLSELIEIARAEVPGVPPTAWLRLEARIRADYGTTRPYIAAHRKRLHLETIAQLQAQAGNDQLAAHLSITPRRIRQLKALLNE